MGLQAWRLATETLSEIKRVEKSWWECRSVQKFWSKSPVPQKERTRRFAECWPGWGLQASLLGLMESCGSEACGCWLGVREPACAGEPVGETRCLWS